MTIQFDRAWAMPNHDTFKIKPIHKFVKGNLTKGIWVDPFVRNSPFKKRMTYTNDLNKDFKASSHMDAYDFLRIFDESSVDGVIFDPPYSPRQISECYKGVGMKVTEKETQSSFWGNIKKEIARVVKPGGIVLSFGWNSGGVGKGNGFTLNKVLLVAHGGWHNDTICVMETKS
jgi:hypothetical protein